MKQPQTLKAHLYALSPEPAKGPPPYPSAGGGLTYAQGPHARCEKILVFKKIYSKYQMNKHVESLSKVDKSITFHYCAVICDVLRPISFYWKDNTNCIWYFAFEIFLKWANLQLSVKV